MGKLSVSNLQPATITTLQEKVLTKRFYVDAVNGSDENDGLSVDTSFKTLTKVSELLKDKKGAGVEIMLSAGEYYDTTFTLMNTNISIVGREEGVILTNSNVSNSCLTLSTCKNVMLSNVTIRPIAGSAITTVKAYYVQRFQTSNVIVDHTLLTGVVTAFTINDNTTAGLECECKSVNRLLEAQMNSSTTILAGFTHDSPALTAVILGGTVLSTIKPVPNFTVSGSGVYANILNDYSVIESGANENGRYVKYADGRLEMTIEKSFDPSVSRAMTVTAPTSFVYGSACCSASSFAGPTPTGDWLDHSISVDERADSKIQVIALGLTTNIKYCHVALIVFARWK